MSILNELIPIDVATFSDHILDSGYGIFFLKEDHLYFCDVSKDQRRNLNYVMQQVNQVVKVIAAGKYKVYRFRTGLQGGMKVRKWILNINQLDFYLSSMIETKLEAYPSHLKLDCKLPHLQFSPVLCKNVYDSIRAIPLEVF